MRALRRFWFVVIYYLSWFVFGAVGLALNVGCLVLMLAPRRMRPRISPRVRNAIRHLFTLWLKWTHFTRAMPVRWHGFSAPLSRGTVYIANHPSLLDATVLLARLPDAVCIFKPSLMRNPAIGPAAIMAGYAAGQSGVDLVREVAGKIQDGQSLLIFPEGTRTAPRTVLGELRPGFALIASRAQAPVQLITIRGSAGLVPRGRRWWKPPTQLPASMDLTLDRRWEYDPQRTTTQLTEEVAAHLRGILPPVPP